MIILWLFDVVALIYFLMKCKAAKKGVTIFEMIRDIQEERKLRKLWRKEMG